MTNSWTKQGNSWAVQCPTQQAPGAVVTVSNRAGEQKTVTLGALLASTRWGFVYAVAQAAPRETAQVGKVDGILALFDRVKAKRMKTPALVVGVPVTDRDAFIRQHPLLTLSQNVKTGESYFLAKVYVATARAKVPGSITVVSADSRDPYDDRSVWFGRLLTDGTFQPSRKAPDALAARLAAFAAEPGRIAGEAGRLVGRCCFCNIALSQGKSTAVGYGETCAANWGLPWGKDTEAFVAEAMPAQPVRKIDLDDNPQDYAPDYEGDIYAGTLRRA